MLQTLYLGAVDVEKEGFAVIPINLAMQNSIMLFYAIL